jgi:uncharacterized membrane protein YfcA
MAVETVAPAALFVVAAYTVFGITGFGASIVALPLLAHVMPLRTAVPMMLVFDLVAGTILAARNRGIVARADLVRLVPFILGGMTLGVTALVNAPERLLLGVLGAFVVAYAAFSMRAPIARTPIAAGWAAPLGLAGGVFTALFGTGGPIYTIYLARRVHDTRALRATLAALIMFNAVARLALFTVAGLYAHSDALRLGATLVPAALIGLYAGSKAHARLPARRVLQAVWILLVVGGASLLWRSVRGEP